MQRGAREVFSGFLRVELTTEGNSALSAGKAMGNGASSSGGAINFRAVKKFVWLFRTSSTSVEFTRWSWL